MGNAEPPPPPERRGDREEGIQGRGVPSTKMKAKACNPPPGVKNTALGVNPIFVLASLVSPMISEH